MGAVHELAITRNIVDTVLRHTGDRQVSLVRLEVGRLCGVAPESIELCFEVATEGTPLRGASLEIDRTPGRARCRACGDDFEVADLLASCRCGSADVEIIGGRDLLVASVEVAQPPGA